MCGLIGEEVILSKIRKPQPELSTSLTRLYSFSTSKHVPPWSLQECVKAEWFPFVVMVMEPLRVAGRF